MLDFDLTWLLLGLPVAFGLGWLASRLDMRQWHLASQSSPKPFFEGLNHLLNAREDEAIDAFIRTAQQDPQATELHFALGNLFRNRGDHDRAIRVYEHLLAHPDLPITQRQRAQHALAQAFLKAGILDRAQAQLEALTHTPYRDDALMALLGLYERTSEWHKALAVAQRLHAESPQLDFSSRMAHYHCELALLAQGEAITEHLAAALAQSPWHIRTHVQWADHQATHDPAAALARLLALAEHVPAALPLITARLVQGAAQTGQSQAVRRVLEEAYAHAPSLDVLHGLLQLLPPQDTAAQSALLLGHLAHEPSLIVATDWLLIAQPTGQPLPEAVTQALHRACAPRRRYRCAACGFETTRHFWQCPGCQTWDSYHLRRVEEL